MHVFRGARDACTAFAAAMSRHGTFCRGETVTAQSLQTTIPQLDALCDAHPVTVAAVAHYKQLCRLLICACSVSNADEALLVALRAHTEVLIQQIETVCNEL